MGSGRGSVLGIFRYPLKSAGAEDLTTVGASIRLDGLVGDREWACLDASDGTIVSAKHPRRGGQLLLVSARGAGTVLVRTPEGPELVAGSPWADAALSAWLGRPVQLVREIPERARAHRLVPEEAGMVPSWSEATAAGQERVWDVLGARPGGRFVDFAALHLVTRGALDTLQRVNGSASLALQRFRPNLLLDLPEDPAPGQRLRVGGVELRIIGPTPRCIVPSLAQRGLDADPVLLRTLARAYRMHVPGCGTAACFGTYAEVMSPGEIRGADSVDFLD